MKVLTRCSKGQRRAHFMLACICVFGSVLGLDTEITTIYFEENGYYKGRCGKADVTPQLPPPRLMRFERVTLIGCPPPANGSYAAALLAVNVTTDKYLALQLPSSAHLTADALADLSTLESLKISAEKPLALDPDAIAPLASLRQLSLERVRPGRLPPNLDKLKVHETGIEELPQDAFNVEELEVSEPNLVSIPRAHECKRLRKLTLARAAAPLPAALVASCPVLQELKLHQLNVTELPPAFLVNTTQLVQFWATFCPFSLLPQDLFAYSFKLRHIRLSDLGLQSIPNGLFSRLGSLRFLWLNGNRLTARDARAENFPGGLRTLDLSQNPLGDLCPVNEASTLVGLSSLQRLSLRGTGLTHICSDWRYMPGLRVLNLTDNDVHSLSCADIHLRRSVGPASIDLSGNPVAHVNCTQEDFERSAGIRMQDADLMVDSQLQCDCDTYWLARMSREHRMPLRFEPLCATTNTSALHTFNRTDRRYKLRIIPLTELTCFLPFEQCVAGCSCEFVPHLSGVRATCEQMSRLPILELDRIARRQKRKLVELRATGAGVQELPVGLPLHLQMLDLDNNNITQAAPQAVGELFASDRLVRLTHNPLVCDCSNRVLLNALQIHQHLVVEYANTSCANGEVLEAAVNALQCYTEDDSTSPSTLVLVLTVGGVLVALILAVGLVATMIQPATRIRLKAFFHAQELRACWFTRRLEPLDTDRHFDVYIAHTEEDERFVAEELVPRLEPLKLCLAYRDWPAGAWIPTQIDESVRRSRRTLCVVSQHSLASHWARAELRAAHAHSICDSIPRLVLLLLDVSLVDLDAEMRAVLETHYYLRWGQPGFWGKLAHALPDLRQKPVKRPTARVI